MSQTAPTTSPVATAASVSKKRPKRTPYPHLFRLLHWVLPAALIVSLVTGLSLHAVARPGWSFAVRTRR